MDEDIEKQRDNILQLIDDLVDPGLSELLRSLASIALLQKVVEVTVTSEGSSDARS
jgi:hypothetical protein